MPLSLSAMSAPASNQPEKTIFFACAVISTKPAAAGRQIGLLPKLGDIHIALDIDLEEGEERDIEARALKIDELLRRRHIGIRIGSAAEGEIGERHAAHRALFDRPGDCVRMAFFEQDARHLRADAEAEIGVMPPLSSMAARRAMTFSTPCSASLKLDQGA